MSAMQVDSPVQRRFWKKVDQSGECWEWLGHKTGGGYGLFYYDEKRGMAHRFAYETFSAEPIPEGLFIDHTCHNRSCVRPAHLRLATRKQNAENLGAPGSKNKTGFRGVFRSGAAASFTAVVMHNGEGFRRGGFGTAEEASAAAQDIRNQLYTHNDLDRRTS
jgi:hypothetical protein